MQSWYWLAVAVLELSASSPADVVHNAQELRQALARAQPGTRIQLAPGDYEYFEAQGVQGTADQPIVLVAQDPQHPPVFRQGLKFSDVAHFELAQLQIEGAPANGMNIDDAGTYETPSHHVRLRQIVVRNCGGRDNHDGIKLSGVQDFRVEDCTVEFWGRGGSAVDMVGCLRGVFEGCTLRDRENQLASSGIQAKGGTQDIQIRLSRFEHAGERAVHIGGSTALQFFRPKPGHFEAKDITVEGCTFVGSTAPIAFVGVDGALVRFNTIYRPRKWVARILQETREPGFVACRNGIFRDNLIVYRASEMQIAVNVGPHTAPETFQFSRNFWYCLDDASRPAPKLPVAEHEAQGGSDPRFLDAEHGNLRVSPESPARAYGAHAWKP